MKRVYKYELGIKEKQSLDLPKDSKIIRVDDVDGRLFLWAIIEDSESKLENRVIELYKTGMPLENYDNLGYLGFCKVFIGQELGMYVFERIESKS